MSGHASVYVDASDQVNRYLAAQTGLTVQQVRFLRAEFDKQGRNPMPEVLEILAVENGFEETQVKVKQFFTIALNILNVKPFTD
ncbi:hypothetical protein M514_10967 [Trichuris suis]|uniref:Uncharacterized protein n=1 Tax=Trichuris suis TaxID=68888 RepID=A0A085MXH2_9BILA|nr:hypothetical protein M513_10967 [Trichuris suis]KFD61918.1 hypothetical protein M514_10967 [Trichuris suis]